MDNNLGLKINSFFELKSKKDKLNLELKSINAKLEEIQDDIINEMDNEGLFEAKSKLGKVFRKVKVIPQIQNKELFFTWAVRNKRFDMLQSRVSPAPIIEMLEEENELPDGISTFTKQILNKRSVK